MMSWKSIDRHHRSFVYTTVNIAAGLGSSLSILEFTVMAEKSWDNSTFNRCALKAKLPWFDITCIGIKCYRYIKKDNDFAQTLLLLSIYRVNFAMIVCVSSRHQCWKKPVRQYTRTTEWPGLCSQKSWRKCSRGLRLTTHHVGKKASNILSK